jgi:hypothetical protein
MSVAASSSSSSNECMALVPYQAPETVVRRAVDKYREEQRAKIAIIVNNFAARNQTLLPVARFTDVCAEPKVVKMMEDVEEATKLPKSIVALAVAYEELPVSMTRLQFNQANQMTSMMFNMMMRSGQIAPQTVVDNLTCPESETRILVETVTPRVRGTLRQLAQMLQRVASADLARVGLPSTPAMNRAVEISCMRVLLPVAPQFIAITDRVTTTYADSASQEHLSTPFPA